MLGALMNRSSGLENGAGIVGRWMQEILFAVGTYLYLLG
jgi:hypothetical protein